MKEKCICNVAKYELIGVHRHHFVGARDGVVVTDVAAAGVDVAVFVVAVGFVIVAAVAFSVPTAAIAVGFGVITAASVVVTFVLAVALTVAV
jgi:hypothetical protein